jgi:DNA-binding Lrp family transcriptional regulator
VLESIDPAAIGVKPRQRVPRKFRISWNPKTVGRDNLLQRRNLFDDSDAFAAIVRPNGDAGERMLDDIGGLKQEPEFLNRMRARPEVLECHHIAGDYSYLLKLRLTGTSHLERFLSEQVKSIGGIRRIHSIIALSSEETRQIDTTVPGTGQ